MTARRNLSKISPAAKSSSDNVDIVVTGDAGDWIDTYPGAYEAASRKARRQRADRREAERQRRQGQPAVDLTADQQAARDGGVARHESKKAAVEARFRLGYVWSGGPVGGSSRYYLPPLRYRGLVSDEHPLLKLAVQYMPRVRDLRTGNTKAESKAGDSKALALDDEYVDFGGLMRGVVRVDLDADFRSYAAIRAACDAAGIPQPSVIVGHRRMADGAILHPHLIWLLDAPVCFTRMGRPGPKALWWRVLRGLTFALLRHGADHGALSNAMRAKNPVSPKWSRDVAGNRPYSLAELARHVRMDVSDDEMRTGRPTGLLRSECARIDPAAGSNALFVALGNYARANVADRRAVGVELDEWRHELVSLALTLADNERQAQSTALRVADYTWARSEPRQHLDANEVSRRQAEAGRQTAADRRKASTATIVATYRNIVQKGGKPTQAAVQEACGLGIATVKRCWQSVLADVGADDGIRRSTSDKKGAEGATREVVLATAPTTEDAVPARPMLPPCPFRRLRNPCPTKYAVAYAVDRVEQPIDTSSTAERRAVDYATWRLSQSRAA